MGSKRLNASTQKEGVTSDKFRSLLIGQGIESPASYYGYTKNGYQLYRHRSLAKFIGSVLQGAEIEVAADIGCGTGHFTQLVKTELQIKQVTGLEFVPELVSIASREHRDIQFLDATLPVLPFASASLDLVIASEVLYYMTPDGQVQCVAEIERVLKPGGYLFVTTSLGEDYFSPETLFELLLPPFTKVAERRDYMRLYHSLSFPFLCCAKLGEYVSDGKKPDSEVWKIRIKKADPILKIFLARFLVQIIAAISRVFLASSSIPSGLSILSRALYPGKSLSNMTVIVKKP